MSCNVRTWHSLIVRSISKLRIINCYDSRIIYSSEWNNRYCLCRTLIFASPIQEVFPGDPFGGKDIVPVRNLKERSTREGNPSNDPVILARSNRPLAVQDARRFPTDYTRNPFQPDSTTYPLPHVMHPPFRRERELQYLLHNRHSLESMGTSARADETPRAYRNDVSFPSYDGMLSERVNRWSTSSNEYDNRHEDHPANSKYLSNRRRQATGLTRSLTERRPKIAHLDRNFRRSFTGRVEDYRMENAKRTNFSIETSL